MSNATKTLLIDDHALFRAGLALMLGKERPQIQTSEAADCQAALQMRGQAFGLVLMDWHLPGLNGFAAMSALKQAFADAFFVVISSEEDAALIRRVLEEGACGYIPKTSAPAVMLSALDLVLAKGVYLPPQALVQVQHSVDLKRVGEFEQSAALTQRQRGILGLALKGIPNKLIADKFNISEGTVKSHLSSAYRLMGVRNRTEALYAIAQAGDSVHAFNV